MEFHVSRKARDHYHFDKSLFSLNGNVIFADFHAARIFTKKINDKRNLIEFPESAVKSGEIAAIGLIDEILHYIFLLYRKHIAPEVLGESINTLKKIIGEEKVEETLEIFCKYFPPINVYLGNQSVNDYLNDQTEGISNRLITLEELIMLWLANANPALTSYVELFDDTDLAHQSAYNQIIQGLKDFFKTQPPFGPKNQSLIDMLSEPAIQSPHSIEGQLEYIRQNWGYLLGNLLFRILKNLDLIKEEQKNTLPGPGTAHVLDFLLQSRSGLLEEERFSPDQEWMPKLVLIAKNTYVWLDQLSKHYQRSIHRLDQIPDEALDQLAEWGFTGLWLIGLWERSSASKKIKQFCGNQDAVSSAYSLYDYVIAEDLGGEEAYQQLRSKAWKRGIRLAADMVPNHVGIYSKWIIEHPDWFIYTNYCPFPAYTFNGANLSEDPRVKIKIEDHYYDKKDAAVVFKRTDLWTGDTKFIYHGNDGTSMPWNDTAQLNYLKPQVREAVIQTILHVARKFPIIRFDAAMTLTKKHYQRLWFPEPGSGGDIPSRSEFGMTKEQFDKAMPHEFWREVVDRVAAEIPDTLLLAEAFWLMEGYFVRTLGMHRVYNSAFMNMLRDEKNAEYRQLIKNTLEFDPQILKRYVNFMNNPDEETAVAQFGKDDKYFGICTLLVTLPGLPMFGHGQIEGLTEKYGMEFKRPYWDESPDQMLIERHKKEIFPLMHKRSLFADVEHFRLFDLYTAEGKVDENVIAYTNRTGEEHSLVVFNNKWGETRGWLKTSAAYLNKTDSLPKLHQNSLGESLGLTNDPRFFAIFKDHITGLEYIRNNKSIYEQGFYVALKAYKYQVFLDFREVQDTDWGQYAQLNQYLNGRGVPDINTALKELLLQPIHYPFHELVNPGMYHWLLEHINSKRLTKPIPKEILDEVEQKTRRFLTEIINVTHTMMNIDEITSEIKRKTEIILNLPVSIEETSRIQSRDFKLILHELEQRLSGLITEKTTRNEFTILFTWLFTHLLGKSFDEHNFEERSRSLIDEWMLGKIIRDTYHGLGLEEPIVSQDISLIKILSRYQSWVSEYIDAQKKPYQILEALLQDKEVNQYIHINRYQGILWFNKEAFEELIIGLFLIGLIQIHYQYEEKPDIISRKITPVIQIIQALLINATNSEYQIEKLLELTKS